MEKFLYLSAKSTVYFNNFLRMMKKCRLLTSALLTLLFIIGTGSAYGQTYVVNEGFEGETFPPDGWTTIDNDGDGHCWTVAGKGKATLSGEKIAISYTVNPENGSQYGAQDNYLVTPKISVTNAAFKLSFKYCAEDDETVEKLQVLVSETGTSAADFTKVVKDITVDNGYDGVTLQSTELSLTEYAGKEIYIAFRHTGSNTYALGIDDVKVMNMKGPKSVSGMSVTPGAEGALSAALAWTNPAKNGAGETITEGLAVGIYRDAHLIQTISEGLTPGEKSTYTDNSVTTGTHKYSIIAKTAEGQSLPVSKTAYIGEDTPEAIATVKITYADGKNTIKWEAPKKGANKGYINPTNITYKISRNTADGEVLLAENLSALEYEDTPERGVLISYNITPKNAAGTGATTKSGESIAYDASLTDVNVAPNACMNNGNPKLPLDVTSKVAVSQSIFLASDFKFAYGNISDIVLKNSFRSEKLEKDVKIWLVETEMEDLSENWIPAADMTLVYDGKITFLQGDNDIPLHLATPFQYKGKNLVMLAMMQPSIGSGTYFDRFYVEVLQGNAVRSRLTTSYSSDFDIATLAPTMGDKLTALPSVRFILKAKGVATVGGTVTNKTTGAKVKGARIEIPALNITTVTDENGQYSLGLVKTGSHEVKVSAVGYVDYTTTLAVADEGEQTENFQLTEMATVSISGKVSLEGVDKAKDVTVSASGYSENTASTDADGNYTITLYEGKDYTLTASYPLFDNSRIEITAAAAKGDADFTLQRSLIPPFDLAAKLGDDGKTMLLSWQAPEARTGERFWTVLGNSMENDNTSSEYYSKDDFYVAHAFTAEDLTGTTMPGMSFTKMKAYLKGTTGNFYAEILRGTRESHTTIFSKEITDKVTAEGGWAEVDFSDTPVEIRKGEDYLVAIHVVGSSDAAIGHGPAKSSIEGKNNVKWSDVSYSYNGYYAWNISAYVDIPGCTDGTYGKPAVQLPAYTYSIYRKETPGTKEAELIEKDIPAGTLSYTDSKWKFTESGKYQYLIKAVYAPEKESMAALSDTVTRAVNYDAGVVAILSPVKAIDEQTTVSVRVSIKNYGEMPLTSVPVCVKIDEKTTLNTTFTGNIQKGETAEVELGTATLKPDTYYNIEAYTMLEGDGMADNDAASMYLPNVKDVYLHAFRWDAYGDAGLFNIHSNVPEAAEYVKEITPNNYLINAAEYLNGRIYGFTATYNNVPGEFVELDPATWAPLKAVATTTYVMDMAYDYATSKMYALGIMDGGVCLLTVDLTDGTCDKQFPTEKPYHALACSTEGTLYGIAEDGNLYTIDKLTGAETVVGNTGVKDILYLQTMAYDHNTGRMFWVHDGKETAGELYEIIPATGETRLMGTVMFDGYPSCMIGMYVPYEHKTNALTAITGDGGNRLQARFNAAGNVEVTLPLAQGETAAVSITTMSGSLVATASASAPRTLIPVSLPSGVYIVKAVLTDGTRLAVKIQK